jgi:hypothetical protein
VAGGNRYKVGWGYRVLKRQSLLGGKVWEDRELFKGGWEKIKNGVGLINSLTMLKDIATLQIETI